MSSKTQLAVGLDAGSSRTRCIICALEGEHLRYLGHGLASSTGWAKGRIADQEAVAESIRAAVTDAERGARSEEHTSELQSRGHLVCRLLLEKKKTGKT